MKRMKTEVSCKARGKEKSDEGRNCHNNEEVLQEMPTERDDYEMLQEEEITYEDLLKEHVKTEEYELLEEGWVRMDFGKENAEEVV